MPGDAFASLAACRETAMKKAGSARDQAFFGAVLCALGCVCDQFWLLNP
jgi:hypothetical protein